MNSLAEEEETSIKESHLWVSHSPLTSLSLLLLKIGFVILLIKSKIDKLENQRPYLQQKTLYQGSSPPCMIKTRVSPSLKPQISLSFHQRAETAWLQWRKVLALVLHLTTRIQTPSILRLPNQNSLLPNPELWWGMMQARKRLGSILGWLRI